MKVFMFHDVYSEKSLKWLNSKFNNRLNIMGLLNEKIFEEKIKFIVDNYIVISTDQYYNNDYNIENFDKLVIITFDDGLKDNFINVLPILIKYNINATFFISSKPLIEKKVLDVHKIQFIIANENLKISYFSEILGDKYNNLWSKYSLTNHENNTWNKRDIFITNLLRDKTYSCLINDLFNEYVLDVLNINEKEFVENFYFSLHDAKDMKKNGQIIACHGYHHTVEDDKMTIKKTDNFLIDNGIFSNYFSYPNGNIYDIDYKLAFTTENRDCKQKENKLLIPRINCVNINDGKKIILFGIQKQGLEIVKYLINNNIRITHLVTINKEKATKLKTSGWVDYNFFCDKYNIELYHCDKYSLKSGKDFKFFKDNNFDLAILGGWQRLIPENIINTFKYGIIGQHGSSEMLPRCRGRSPVNWSLLLNKERLIWNIFFIKPGVDDGDIIDYKNININQFDTCKTLYYKISIIVKKMYLDNIPKIFNNSIIFLKQSGKATFYEKRSPEDGKINWENSVKEIYNLIRAVTSPYPGAYSFLGPDKIYFLDAQPFDNNIIYHGRKYGEIVEVFEKEFIINCVDGLLLIKNSNLKNPYIGDYFI